MEATDEVKFLLEASGFDYTDSLKFEAVHCQAKKGYKFSENGFYQTYLATEIGYNRITMFPEGKIFYFFSYHYS